MRLIDANNLLEEMGAGCIPILEKGISQVTGDESTIKDYIDQAPTVDAEPVRHGEWVARKEIFDGEQEQVDAIGCSQCGKSQRVFRRTPYCPNCGAKMDGGK